jgi:hypothetical protein
MVKQLFRWVGNLWVGEMLDELRQIATKAKLKSENSKFNGAVAFGNSRQLNVERALRSRSSLLLAMAGFDSQLCNQGVKKTEEAYGMVLGPLFFVMKWRSPIYSSAIAHSPLSKLIASSATCMEGYRFALETRLAWLGFLEQLIDVWIARELDMPYAEPGPPEVLRYRGVAFDSTGTASSEMIENARRASYCAAEIKTLMAKLQPYGDLRTPRNTRSALVAAECALNGRYAHELRQVIYTFECLYLAASRFWKLEESGTILPEEFDRVGRARTEVAEALRAACIQLHHVYQAQLEQGEKAKQHFELALSLLTA